MEYVEEGGAEGRQWEGRVVFMIAVGSIGVCCRVLSGRNFDNVSPTENTPSEFVSSPPVIYNNRSTFLTH